MGYRKPPGSSRFQKGRSGNPRGRPKGRNNEAPYESVLGQLVTVREDGEERRVTAAEAFLLHNAKRGLEGDSAAARSTMAAIEEARVRGPRGYGSGQTIVVSWLPPAPVNSALAALRMAAKLDRYRPTARMAIEPWLVEEALSRLNRRLSRDEQAKIVRATRTPHKVRWPDWWEV